MLLTVYPQLIVLTTAALLDFGLGDPWGWPHPVQAMGWLIHGYTQAILRRWELPKIRQFAGILLGVLLIGGSGGLTWLLLYGLHRMAGVAAYALDVVLLASCFAGHSLRVAAEDVVRPLQAEDWEKARSQLKYYVGRDTEQLQAPEILRAIVETVAENTTDGVMAPLFYASLGIVLPMVGPVPFAMAYKAASTLDSMIGYKEAPYTDLGRFSARLEDGLTWLPCRLTVITIGLISGQLRHVLQLCRRDAPQDPSPNAGWSECAFAAVMGVQLGGDNWYQGKLKHKPRLGNPDQPLALSHVYQSLQLMRRSFLLWLSLTLLLGGMVEGVAHLWS